MRSAKIHSITENDHFCEYAEFNWVDRTTEYVRKDKGEKWQFRICLVCFATVCVVYVWPMIWRMFR